MKRIPPWVDLIALAMIIAAAIAIAALTGCGERRRIAEAITIPHHVSPTARVPDPPAVHDSIPDLKARLAAAEARAAEETRQRFRTLLIVVSSIAFLGVLGFGAAAVFVPPARRLFILASLACGAVIVLAQLVSFLLPYLLWIGFGLLLVGGYVLLHRYHKD